MIEPIVKRVGGIDVHKGIVVVTVLKEDDEGGIGKETKEYRTYWKELREMAKWLKKEEVELVVMESTGVYWKCGDLSRFLCLKSGIEHLHYFIPR